MRLTRIVAALTFTLTLSLAAGCSGDDGDKDEPGKADSSATTGSDSPTPSADSTEEPGDVVQTTCKATVSITGKVTADWDGKAEVRLSKGDGPKAVYRSTDDKRMVTAYSEGKDFQPSVNVVVGDTTYATTPGDPAGLEIGVKGKGAEVDADAFDVAGDQVHVTASFDC
jgi:hypothetical protein